MSLNDYKPFECMMTHSNCYLNTRKMVVKGVLWHSTGANNPWLKRYVNPYEGDPGYSEKIKKIGKNGHNDWNHQPDKPAGLNAWIGKYADGTIGTVQAMPWDYRPWGCGTRYKKGYSCNDNWVQFEICEDYLVETYPGSQVWIHRKGTQGDKEYAKLVWDEAVRFTAYICKMYNLDPFGTVSFHGKEVPVILDHKTSWEFGFGSGHGDIRHWFSVILGKDMKDARKEVYDLMHKDDNPKELDGYKVDNMYVVACDALNVRTAADSSATLVTTLDKGTKAICRALTRDNQGNTWMRISSKASGWMACLYNGQKCVEPSTGWIKDSGIWYYYKEGELVKSEWIKYNDKMYYVDANGSMVTGWRNIDGVNYYFYPGNDGHMASGEWIDDLWLDRDGKQTYPYKGEWKSNERGQWYEDESGWYPRNKKYKIDKIEYTFNNAGYVIS